MIEQWDGEILTIVSLLAVFMTVHFNMLYQKSESYLEKNYAPLVTDKEKWKKEWFSLLRFTSLQWFLQSTIPYVALLVIYLPTTLYIFKNYAPSLIDIELKTTLLFFIILYIFVFLGMSLWRFGVLCKKLWKTRKWH